MNPYGLPPYMPPNGAPPMVPPYINQPGMVPAPTGFGTVVAASAPVLTSPPIVARPSGTPLIPAITTVYVGKIAPTVEDDFIRRLLDQCGKVKNWRRIADPVTGKLKGFGFCDYESPEGVLRALRLLANVKLDGSELLLKVDEKTQKLLDVYLKSNPANETKQKEEDDAVNATLTFLLTRRAREMGLLEDVAKSKNNGNATATTATTTSTTSSIPTMTPIIIAATGTTAAKNVEPSKETVTTGIATAMLDKDKEKEARRREREEREYRDRERNWEDREISKLKEREKEYFKLKKQAQRLDRDLSYDDNERKKRTKEYYRRKREREKEREEDEIDRQKEIQEKEMIQQHLEKKRRELEALNEPPPPPTASPERDQLTESSTNTAEDAYYNSIQQSTYTPPSLSYTTITMSPVEDVSMSPVDRSKLSGFALSTANKERKPVVPLAAGFATETEHDDVYSNKKKKLTTLDAHMQEENERRAKLEQLKNLIDTIPTEKTQLFAIQMNWDLIDQNQVPERKMRPWIGKKIVEYLGEEEKTLIEFILSKVVAHTPPYELLEQLSVVLDEEAETFVLKMWRMLVFEMLAIQNNLQTS